MFDEILANGFFFLIRAWREKWMITISWKEQKRGWAGGETDVNDILKAR